MKSWSLQNRLALAIGTAVTVLWLLASLLTAHWLSLRVDEILDDELRATAQRILPLAMHDLNGRKDHDEEAGEHEIDRLPDDDEGILYQVRDFSGAVLLQSKGASASELPDYSVAGYSFTPDLRVYQEAVDDARVTITVAEPMSGRWALARSMLLQLLLPLLVVIPLSLLAIAIATARGFAPLRILGEALSRRGAQDLSPLAGAGLPRELKPFAAEVNDLLDRLRGAFEAERSFAANAAHELRTPVAGAIAQAQRLKSETQDAGAIRRADEIEATLKRLMKTSEKLMQLARAEGGRMRQDKAADIRPVVKIIVEDFRRAGMADRCRLRLPDRPVPSVIEPDALGILLRNLIENALRHGAGDLPVEIDLTPEAVLTVSNEGAVLPPDVLDAMTHRFQRGSNDGEGAGLGLAIVTAIAERAEAEFSLVSPIPGRESGVSARVALPRG